jgi:hypothetical protein
MSRGAAIIWHRSLLRLALAPTHGGSAVQLCCRRGNICSDTAKTLIQQQLLTRIKDRCGANAEADAAANNGMQTVNLMMGRMPTRFDGQMDGDSGSFWLSLFVRCCCCLDKNRDVLRSNPSPADVTQAVYVRSYASLTYDITRRKSTYF